MLVISAIYSSTARVALLSFASLFTCALSMPVLAQEPAYNVASWKYRSELLTPFWESEVVDEESVLFVRDPETGESRGLVLFPIAEILTVTNSAGNVKYQSGVDYRYEPGTRELVIPKGSKVVTSLASELRRPANSQAFRLTHRDGGDEILFGGKLEYHEMQTLVTYKKKDAAWPKQAPKHSGEALVRTLKKLQSKEPVTIVLLGDSISTGCNASGWGGGAPFQPAYQDLLLQHLQQVYSPDVKLVNLAVGGMATPWGISKMEEVVSHKPDLVILAFGMNDAGGLSVEDYKANTQKMIESAKDASAETEIILVATMLGNRDWTALKHDVFPKYRDALSELCGPGIALADMTSVWEEMLRRKKDADLTGNGVNHPNDFGHRVYAQVLAQLLVSPSIRVK